MMEQDELFEALRLLRMAEYELELLYAFAISCGIPEAGDPPHQQIKRFLVAHEHPRND